METLIDGASAVRAAFIAQSRQARAATRADVEDLWRVAVVELTDASMRRFTERAAAVVEGAQATVAAGTVAYLDALERTVTGRRSTTFDPTPTGANTKALRGVDRSALWHRPVARVWRALGAGHDRRRAVDIGRARAVELVTTGLQLAHTVTAAAWMASAPVESYRASLNGPCGLCVLGATKTLEPDQRMPIHTHCGCVAWPRFVGHPALRPAGEPSGEALRAAVVELTGQSAINANAFRAHVAVVEHGEIGPLLRRKGDHFTGPSDIHAA